jgi:hypothetical protein
MIQSGCGDEKEVHPRVHLKAPGAGTVDEPGQGVEGARLPLQKDAAGHEPGGVEGVSPAADLDEERVEPPGGGVVDHPVDLVRGHEGGPDDP